MKRLAVFALVLALGVMMFTGCGCRNSQPMPTTVPTTTPTGAPTQATTAPTQATSAPTQATTEATRPTAQDPTVDSGNGPAATEQTPGTEGRSRRNMPMEG